MTVTYRIMKQPANSADQARAKWVASLMPGAEPTAIKLGISPEAVIAQAALETGWGRAAIGNNIFGIKADASWHGKTQTVSTWEDTNGAAPGGEVQIVDRFRDYDSIADSFADHFAFLERNTRYRDAGVFARAGDEAYFQALKRGGYATDPAYVAKLLSILATVKSYTAGMERVVVDVPKGYEVTESGNVVNPNPEKGTIIKAAGNSNVANTVTTAAGVAAPIVTSLAGLDWKVVLIISAAILIGGGFVWWNNSRVKEARRDMARQGVV